MAVRIDGKAVAAKVRGAHAGENGAFGSVVNLDLLRLVFNCQAGSFHRLAAAATRKLMAVAEHDEQNNSDECRSRSKHL